MASDFAKGCYAEGWVGAAAGVALPPQYLNPPLPSSAAHTQMMHAQALQMAQNALANQQNIGQLNSMNSAALQWNASPVTGAIATTVVTVQPVERIGRQKIDALIEQLPLKVLRRILSISMYDEGERGLKFTVLYTDMRTQDFCNVDEFPSPADVSLVILGTP